jgi:hypothetical protein
MPFGFLSRTGFLGAISKNALGKTGAQPLVPASTRIETGGGK